MSKAGHVRIVLFATLIQIFTSVSLAVSFPASPHSQMTPGSLCESPTEYRYPEQIPYCEREVDSELKWEVIRRYNSQLGYSITPEVRNRFKIDHFIPLCMGGSNNVDNLWPQHESVFSRTDILESTACEKMKEGRLLQRDAVELIRQAKLDTKQVSAVLKRIMAY